MGTSDKKLKREEPTSGIRPIIHMILYQGQDRHPVTVLLDTGCSVPLINERTAERLRLQPIRHREQRTIENFTGQTVKGAGEYYTNPLVLQHRKHFSREIMEVSPMDKEINIFLPFWWIAKHPPQSAWENTEVRFNSPSCLESCIRYEAVDFFLTWDDAVAICPEARIIGHVAIVQTETEDPWENVPEEFREYLDLMFKEATEALPAHKSYDCRIELKEGEVVSWGPIYPLSENELETLREWLKEMLKSGKICRSTSPAGSPILFVRKPNGRGL